MSLCERVRSQLPQYVADGEPSLACYSRLRAHLVACGACQDYARRLCAVEEALRSYPAVAPSRDLTAAVLRNISEESPALQEEWHLLPWDVWVPAMALLLGLAVAVVCLPPHVLPAAQLPDLESTLSDWPASVNTWLAPVYPLVAGDQFWALWSGVFAAGAGIGISLSLNRWNALHTKGLNELEARVESVASRVRSYTRLGR